jgi:hypothetical protein
MKITEGERIPTQSRLPGGFFISANDPAKAVTKLARTKIGDSSPVFLGGLCGSGTWSFGLGRFGRFPARVLESLVCLLSSLAIEDYYFARNHLRRSHHR